MSAPFAASRRCALVLLALALGIAGCGDSKPQGPSDSVSGKVLLNGEPVSGEVVFVAADKKQFPSPIALDGSYRVVNVSKGEAQILVRGLGGGTLKGKVGAKGAEPGLGTGGGTQPPKKYATPGNGLKLMVTGGHQTHDLTLQP
jgi:hypothetical protein